MAKIPVLQGGTGKDEAPSRFAKLQKAIEDANRNMISVLKLIEKNTKATLAATKDLVKVSKKSSQSMATGSKIAAEPVAPVAAELKPKELPEKKQEEGNASVTFSAIAAGAVAGGVSALKGKIDEYGKKQIDTAQDQSNLQQMPAGQKIVSYAARGIENVGSLIYPGLGHAAAVERVQSETERAKDPLSRNYGITGRGTNEIIGEQRIARRRAAAEAPAQEPAGVTVQKKETYNAEQFRTADPENFNKMQVRAREIENQLLEENKPRIERADASGRGTSSRIIKEKIKIQAEERAREEFAQQISAAGAGSKSVTVTPQESRRPGGEQVTQATNENRDLQSQAQGQASQPVILNNNNTVSQQSFTPAPATPRGSSPYESFNNSRAFYR